MYLLDTQVFLDFIAGDPEDPDSAAAMAFVTGAEAARRRVSVSVVSIGMVRWHLTQLEAGPDRDNLERRLDVAIHEMELGTQLYDLDREMAESWVRLKSLDLRDIDGRVMGDDERMVAATALAKSLTLVTRWPPIYELAVRGYGLAVRQV